MTNEAEKHAQQRLTEAVKYVTRQWGHGFHRLAAGQQESLVRAEVLAEISRVSTVTHGVDAEQYRALVTAMAAAAMAWQGGVQS